MEGRVGALYCRACLGSFIPLSFSVRCFLMNLGAEGSIISDSQAGELLKLTQSARMVRSVTFNPQQFLSQVNTGDEALTAFYNEKKADYLIPEAVKFQYAVLSLQDLAAKQTVSEQELKTAFEHRPTKASRAAEYSIF